MNRMPHPFLLFLLLLTPLSFSGCAGLAAIMGIELYDAPVDDPLYAGVYLTIAGLEINEERVDDFPGKMTLEVSALQNGLTAQLAKAEVAPGKYDEITLVLDYDSDENGQAPGCYVNTIYDRKIDLANGRSGQEVINLSRAIDIKQDEDIDLVIDFDLRKTIRPSRPRDESEASLIEGRAVGPALRVVRKSNTGNLLGQLTLTPEAFNQANNFVVYAFPAGTFDRSQEEFDLDEDGITFEGATVSTYVQVLSSQTPATFSLYYLEPGEYDLVFEAYKTLEFSRTKEGFLEVEGATNLIVPVTITQQQDLQVTVSGESVTP